MDIVILSVKYVFVAALAVEGLLIGRALWTLAREKARAAQPVAPAVTEE
ncbi:MAG: hypothetical protein OHK0022_35640 [Roseiflexaceae bacterium]